MSDVGWGSDHLEPPKKRAIPIWILGCAGGCMFFIGAAGVAAYFGVPKVKRWLATQTQPEVQWPKLAEVLPFDERPQGFSIAHAPVPFIDIWQLDSPEQDLIVYVVAAPDNGRSKPWGEWLASPKEAPMFASQKGEFETVEGRLMLQGRELRSVRFTRKGLPDVPEIPEPPGSPTPPDESGHPDPEDFEERPFDVITGDEDFRGDGLALDVTQEGSNRRVLVWLMRGTAGFTVSDDEAKAILAPFKIGPAR